MTDEGLRYIADAIRLMARAIVIAASIRAGYWSSSRDAVKMLES